MERRNTIQKELVLRAVGDLHRHVTADEVYAYLRSRHPTIGKATVYRNLSILSEENRIRRVEIPNGADRFDFRLDKHYHILCIKCGRVFDVDKEQLHGGEPHVCDPRGMLFLDYDILFRGICAECRKQEETTQL